MAFFKPGQTWTRRKPSADAWDRIVIVGVAEVREGEFEAVVAPIGFGPRLQADEASLVSQYELTDDVPDTDPEWISDFDAVLAGRA